MPASSFAQYRPEFGRFSRTAFPRSRHVFNDLSREKTATKPFTYR